MPLQKKMYLIPLDTICIYLPANMLLKYILFGHLHVNLDTLADVNI